jgi:hypothetical protein
MDASKHNPGKGQERTGSNGESEYSADIERGDYGTIRGDCGELTIGGAGVETFVPPTGEARIRIEAQTGEDSDLDQMVTVDIESQSTGAHFSQRLILNGEEAQQLADRLSAAADVMELGVGGRGE